MIMLYISYVQLLEVLETVDFSPDLQQGVLQRMSHVEQELLTLPEH